MNKKLIIGLTALVLVIGILVGVYYATLPKAQGGGKEITVVIVHGDGGEKRFTYQTEEAYLGPVLLAEKLVEGENGKYGLEISKVDGEEASWERDQSYWALYVGEEYASTGADGVVLTDGGVYKLVYTKG